MLPSGPAWSGPSWAVPTGAGARTGSQSGRIGGVLGRRGRGRGRRRVGRRCRRRLNDEGAGGAATADLAGRQDSVLAHGRAHRHEERQCEGAGGRRLGRTERRARIPQDQHLLLDAESRTLDRDIGTHASERGSHRQLGGLRRDGIRGRNAVDRRRRSPVHRQDRRRPLRQRNLGRHGAGQHDERDHAAESADRSSPGHAWFRPLDRSGRNYFRRPKQLRATSRRPQRRDRAHPHACWAGQPPTRVEV